MTSLVSPPRRGSKIAAVSFLMPDDDYFKDDEFICEDKFARTRLEVRPESDYEPVRLVDHPSIAIRSSHVRFRGGSAVRVYDSGGAQLILEKGQKETRAAASVLSEDEEEGRSSNVRPSITLKRASTATYGLYFLRVLYTSMAVLAAGAVFVFFVGMLLFLCADLAQHVHAGMQAGRISTALVAFLGTLLSIPVLLRGLTSIMSLIVRFVFDVFSGGQLLRLFGLSAILTDWMSFFAFIGIPLFTMIGSLFAKSQTVLYNSTISALASLSILFLGFAVLLMKHRTYVAFYLVEKLKQDRSEPVPSLVGKVKELMLLSVRANVSGKISHLVLHTTDMSDEVKASMISPTTDEGYRMVYKNMSFWYAQVTKLRFLSCFFETLEEPQRCWNQDDIYESIPYHTEQSWSLEGLFCRSRAQSFIAVVGGPGALTRKQLKSSRYCVVLGLCMYLLTLVGICVWLETPPIIPAFVTLIFIFWCWFVHLRGENQIRKTYKEAMNTYRNSTNQDENGSALCICQIWKTYAVTRPTVLFSWIYIGLKFFSFFAFPLSYLLWNQNWPMVVTFLVAYVIYLERRYLDAHPVLEELEGSEALRMMEVKKQSEISSRMLGREQMSKSIKQWKSQSRQFQIESINSRASQKFWDRVFYSFLALFFVVVCAAAFSSRTDESIQAEHDALDPWISFPSNSSFYFETPQTQSYPICRLAEKYPQDRVASEDVSPSQIKYLADYAFLGK